MKRLLPLLLILPLAGFRPVPMPPPVYEGGPVRMALVDRDRGTELRSYPAEGQRWVAGERGHRYAVRLYNDSPRRVLVVLSVDGVNASRIEGYASKPQAPALGTGHGAREQSSVRDTEFERASRSPAQVLQLRYDSARNLRARGILVDSPSRLPREPQAFPNRYVPDPPAR